MQAISKQAISVFQQEILTWYEKNKRDLPWRQARDPYSILVSEVMSQQTQIPRVIPKYSAWMEAFPNVEDLANAKTSDVLRLWSGLGYNRRALFLQQAAKKIVAEYNGKFPQTEEVLRKLPGIGEYTSKAVLCFAFNQQVAVVDTNIRKIILLLYSYGIEKFLQITMKNKELGIKNQAEENHNSLFMIHNSKELKTMSMQEVEKVAQQLLPVGKAYEWNQALMDYSSSVLAKEKIPLKKQSIFKGSNRYYRGQIVKLLIANSVLNIEDLPEKLGKTKEEITSIIDGLMKDGIILQEGTMLRFP